MLSAYEFCYEDAYDNFDDQLSREVHAEIELIKYFVYDHYTERDEGYSHYYGATFAELYEDVDKLLNKYNYKGEVIRDAFCEGFDDWENFHNEVDELFTLILKKNNVKVVKK